MDIRLELADLTGACVDLFILIPPQIALAKVMRSTGRVSHLTFRYDEKLQGRYDRELKFYSRRDTFLK